MLKCKHGGTQTRIEQVCTENYEENRDLSVSGLIKEIYLVCSSGQIRKCTAGGLQTRIEQMRKENYKEHSNATVRELIKEIHRCSGARYRHVVLEAYGQELSKFVKRTKKKTMGRKYTFSGWLCTEGQIRKCTSGRLQTTIQQVRKETYKENSNVSVGGPIKEIYIVFSRDHIQKCTPGGLQTELSKFAERINYKEISNVPVNGHIKKMYLLAGSLVRADRHEFSNCV